MIQRNDIEENLKRGILEMLILKMLSQEDMYGYQMINEMNIRGKGLIDIKGLIGKNYISENKILVGKRRTRVYYHLESLGVEYLNTIVDVYSKIIEGVNLIMNYSAEEKQNEENNQ